MVEVEELKEKTEFAEKSVADLEGEMKVEAFKIILRGLLNEKEVGTFKFYLKKVIKKLEQTYGEPVNLSSWKRIEELMLKAAKNAL